MDNDSHTPRATDLLARVIKQLHASVRSEFTLGHIATLGHSICVLDDDEFGFLIRWLYEGDDESVRATRALRRKGCINDVE